MTQETQTFIYTTYIRTTPEKLWEALTNGDFSEKYWFGFRIEADWKPGGTLRIRPPKNLDMDLSDKEKCGISEATGEVLAFNPPRRLAYTFPHKGPPEVAAKRKGLSRATFDLTPMGEMVKLRLVHENLLPEDLEKDSTKWQGINNGWPGVLSSLKTLLETGKEITYTNKAG